MIFKTPLLLFLVPITAAFIFWIKRRQGVSSIRFPSSELFSSTGHTWRTRMYNLPFYFRILSIVLFLIALARPCLVSEETQYKTEGVDIVLAIDISGSMAAEDFTIKGRRVNRLEVVKDVVSNFIGGRKHDRIGLIAFSALAYTVSPLTIDYSWVRANLERIKLGLIKDGTAIGSAISSSLSRLQESEAKSKIVILLTDGMNNSGKMDPVSAAQAAKALGIKIYTIGAGTKGKAPFPVLDMFGRQAYQMVTIDIDEEMLQKIALITGGKYFRATDTASLREIYKEIDMLEKTEIEEFGYREYQELFVYVVLGALGLLLVELLLSNTLLMRLP